MPTREEIITKAKATRLKNLLAKAAVKQLSLSEELEVEKLKAKATAKQNGAT
jgi:hypothetical protein